MFKKLFCKHKEKFCVTNIHGDFINYLACRSVWECKECGKRFFSNKLEPSCDVVNFTIKKLSHQHEDKGE